MQKLQVLELFAGIGACSKALTNQGIDHEIVDAVEIDKYAIKSFNAIHDTNFEPQDITKWDKDIECDLIMHGSPCQDFSVAGKQAGGDKDSGTRSSLMFETLRIVEKLKPKYVIWENVKNLISKKHRHNYFAYIKAMNDLGYKSYGRVLNAKDFGVPQNRERIYTVSLKQREFNWPEPIPLTRRLKDMLEEAVDEKYYLSNKQIEGFLKSTEKAKEKGNGFQFEPSEGNKPAKCISTKAGSRQTDNFIIDDLYKKRAARVYKEEAPALRSGRHGLKVAIRTANAKGYDLASDGDGIDLAYPNSNTRRGRVGHNIAKTIACGDTMGVLRIGGIYDGDGKQHQAGSIYEVGGVAPTLSTMQGGNQEPMIVAKPRQRREQRSTLGPRKDGMTNTLTSVQKDNYAATNFRIRKLTPKECWRLMGFSDEDFEKAEKVNSNTQLYKQAGNSIVVNVLEAILNNLVKEEYDK